MMRWLLLAAAVLVGPAAAQAQAAVPARANVATTHVPDSARVAYARLGQVLVAAGYDLEKASYDAEKAYYLLQPDFKLPAGTTRQVAYLSTAYRNSPQRPELREALQVTVVLEPTGGGATIELRGIYTLDGLRLRPVASQGGNGPAAEAWAELLRVAAMLPGAPPSYRRQP